MGEIRFIDGIEGFGFEDDYPRVEEEATDDSLGPEIKTPEVVDQDFPVPQAPGTEYPDAVDQEVPGQE